MSEIKLPNSKATVRLGQGFSREKTAAKVRELLADEDALAAFSQDPTSALADLGVEVDAENLNQLSVRELAQAVAQRGANASQAGVQAVNPVVLAAIIILAFPDSAE